MIEKKTNSGTPQISGKSSCLIRIRGCKTGEKGQKLGTLLLDNDKNIVIADKVLSDF